MSLQDKQKGSQYIDKETTEELYFGSDVRDAVKELKTKLILKCNDNIIKTILDGGDIDLTETLICIDRVFGFKEEDDATVRSCEVKQ